MLIYTLSFISKANFPTHPLIFINKNFTFYLPFAYACIVAVIATTNL
jgi:hypothetical protein